MHLSSCRISHWSALSVLDTLRSNDGIKGASHLPLFNFDFVNLALSNFFLTFSIFIFRLLQTYSSLELMLSLGV